MSSGLRQHHDSPEQTIRERTVAAAGGQPGLCRDIEIRKEIERNLEKLRLHHEMILNTTSEGILGLNPAGQITFYNRAAEALMGLQGKQIDHFKIQDFIVRIPSAEGQSEPEELLNEVLTRGTRVDHQEGLLSLPDGRTLPIEYSCAPLLGNDVIGAVFSFSDISERKNAERADPEAGLLRSADGAAQSHPLLRPHHAADCPGSNATSQKLALMFIDLDDFKMVNDTLGHAAGDDFLKVIARRLRESSRQADTVARLGGDEFVWIGEIIDEQDARLIAGKFLEGLSRPVNLDRHNFSSTVSIGIALFPDTARDVAGLMKCADAAMYSVKQHSKNAFRFYRQSRDS